VNRPGVRLGSLVALLASLFAAFALSGSLSAEKLHSSFDGYGAAGPAIFIVASSLLTVTMFPGPLLAGAAGLLFGTALGTPVAIVSATLGATMAFALGRWWAHDAVEELVADRFAPVRRLRAWIGERGFLAVLYARLAPAMPYNLVNYAAGLSPVALRAFVGATALGCAPRAFAYAALGGSLDNLGSPEAITAMAVLVVMAVGGVVFARRSGSGRATSSPDVRSEALP
jgi:uncharacterized membrane protein YdjX (TVP38/TMEM64 family)